MAHREGHISVETVGEEMQYLKPPTMHSGRLRQQYVKIYPRASTDITDTSNVEFYITGTLTDQLDLAKTELCVSFHVDKINEIKEEDNYFKAGTMPEGMDDDVMHHLDDVSYSPALEADENVDLVIPIDDFLDTMWSNVRIDFNGTNVFNSNNEHPYLSYIQDLCFTNDDDMYMAEYCKLFTRENFTSKNDNLNPFKAGNRGSAKRYLRVQKRQVVQLGAPLSTDIWHNLKHYMLSGVNMKMILTPCANKFRFNVFPATLRENFVMKIDDIYLNIPYISISQAAQQGLNAGLRTSPAMYPFINTVCNVRPLHKGIKKYEVSDVFQNQLPVSVLVAMVDRDNYSGEYDLNPFFFNRNTIEYAAFEFNNVSIPGEPYHIGQPDNPRSVDAKRRGEPETLMPLLKAMYRITGTTHNGFTPETYKDGKFVIAFDTDPTADPKLAYWPVPKVGNCKITLRFKEPLPCEQQLIVLCRYPGLLKIDHNKNVIIS